MLFNIESSEINHSNSDINNVDSHSSAHCFHSIPLALPSLTTILIETCMVFIHHHDEIFQTSIEDRKLQLEMEFERKKALELQKLIEKEYQLQHYTCQLELLLRKV